MAVHYNSGSSQHSTCPRLNTINEERDIEDSEPQSDIGPQEVPPDAITDPAVVVSLEDIHSARSLVYEVIEGVRPPVDKGKGVDRKAHPNYDHYVGYTRVRPNAADPEFDPGPSNWQLRPRLRDLPWDYSEDDFQGDFEDDFEDDLEDAVEDDFEDADLGLH